jgi:hypothetical protein
MSEQGGTHPDSERVERVIDAMVVFTPCHGLRVLFPLEQAVPEAVLRLVCPRDGVDWIVELVADSSADSGLRAVWPDPSPQAEQ